jgi:AcrR family transcriptional regulator
MSREPAKAKVAASEPAGTPRRIPTQRRARERVEKILTVAIRLIEEKGAEAMTMSEIVELADISFGSLYQYFPDKAAIIRTLAERYNEQGRACVAAELAVVQCEADLNPALGRITDAYYAVFIREPVTRAIWAATQSDKQLQEVDAADMEMHAAMLLEAMRRLRPKADAAALATLARVIMEVLAAAVRYAISVERDEGDRAIATFKRILPADVFAIAAPR